jgi:hypothetical protein
MQIDVKTINVLKNFSSINPSILFKEGNVLKTISPTKTVMAKAVVPSAFTKQFAIYNLSKMLSVLSSYEKPEVSFNEKTLTITDGNGVSTNLPYAEESNIKVPPEREIVLPSVEASFKITQSSLSNILKMAGILSLPEIAVIGDGSNLLVSAIDSKNPSSETHTEKVGTTDKNFRAIFKIENIKLIASDYDVEVSSKGISHFKGADAEYWIAVEQNSTF